ncbi:MAG: hypothetical protein KDJ19_01130 [Hyphomicrobiaceae bacterium]|nr:hypothetical protein [Hyphomicrobiaceae bacterium]MCC0022872.1 hypothetical protein [Hyphomicrobiaceae bacterium]
MTNIIPEGYASAIGEMVLSASRIDSVITDLLAIWSETNIVNAIVSFSHFQPSSKIDTLLALYSIADDDKGERKSLLPNLLKQVRDHFDFRNSIVHAYWTVDDNGIVSTVRFSARGKFTRTKKPVPLEEILQRIDSMNEAERLLRGLRDHMHRQIQDDKAE